MNRKLKITVIAYDDLINGPSLAQFRFAKSLSKLGYNVELLIAFRFFKNDLSRFNDEKIKILNLNKKRTIFLIFVYHFHHPKLPFYGEFYLVLMNMHL